MSVIFSLRVSTKAFLEVLGEWDLLPSRRAVFLPTDAECEFAVFAFHAPAEVCHIDETESVQFLQHPGKPPRVHAAPLGLLVGEGNFPVVYDFIDSADGRFLPRPSSNLLVSSLLPEPDEHSYRRGGTKRHERRTVYQSVRQAHEPAPRLLARL